MRRTKFFIGNFGTGPYNTTDNAVEYRKWADMLHRVYDPNQFGAKQYEDVQVAAQWHDFQTFAAWIEVEPFFTSQGYELDKDILGDGKLYAPTTCAMVPREVNMAVMSRMRKDATLPMGVTVHYEGRSRTLYAARISKAGRAVRLGLYYSPEEAHTAYKVAKANYVGELADKYKSVVKPAVYDALKNWRSI